MRHDWPENDGLLHVAHRVPRCSTLGPGVRSVLWVQGCPSRCLGCISPQNQPFEGGVVERVEDLANEYACDEEICGVTFSGGEPMAQAAAITQLIDQVRLKRDFSFLCYTGFTYEDLSERGTQAQRELLTRLDVLIDGPYIRCQHTDAPWRGSDNQRIHLLTTRHKHTAEPDPRHAASMEFCVGRDGSIYWMGIPPRGFRDALVQGLANRGIVLGEGRAFS